MATANIKLHPIFWFQKHIKKENHVYHGGLASYCSFPPPEGDILASPHQQLTTPTVRS